MAIPSPRATKISDLPKVEESSAIAPIAAEAAGPTASPPPIPARPTAAAAAIAFIAASVIPTAVVTASAVSAGAARAKAGINSPASITTPKPHRLYVRRRLARFPVSFPEKTENIGERTSKNRTVTAIIA